MIYKEFKDSQWITHPHFGEGVIPGFTSGGLAEVVIKSFETPGTQRRFLTPNEVIIDNAIACRAFGIK